ncbi:MAG: hypothetical protein Q9198_006889 [Flavoplaca austrocitrina]
MPSHPIRQRATLTSSVIQWGWTRDLYPPINFVLRKREYKHPDYEVQLWYHNERLVLDLEGRRMKFFHHLPVVCSSQIPGGHIEALMRLDDRMSYSDMRGRMPPRITIKRKGVAKEKPQKGTNALSAAARSFREATGMLSWNARAGSEAFNNYILANLPGNLKARNTTRGWRDLTKAEIMTIREPGIGTRPEQARKRSSADEARRKREKNIQKRKARANAERKKAALNDESDGDLTSLDSDDTEDEEEDGSDSEDEDATDFIDVPDIRIKFPSLAEETIAIQDALVGTIEQAKQILGDFAPIIHEPHSYASQVGNVQQQFDAKYQAQNPDLGKAPTLMHLTSWLGGIQDWRSAKYWDGSTEYLIEEDGTIGSQYSPEATSGDASDKDPGGDSLVDAGGSRIEAYAGSDGISMHIATPRKCEDSLHDELELLQGANALTSGRGRLRN